jgi:hypothetical protein
MMDSSHVSRLLVAQPIQSYQMLPLTSDAVAAVNRVPTGPAPLTSEVPRSRNDPVRGSVGAGPYRTLAVHVGRFVFC